jgi:peptidoglycan/LPS O-acetylase OafA/YrhL
METSPVSEIGSRTDEKESLTAAPRRLDALDSLRGFASLSVVFLHFSLLAPLVWLGRTPARIILGGHEAVILFFVLSGYVLTLQVSGKHYTYAGYLVKRVCRIYLPYLVAMIAMLLVTRIIPARQVPLGTFFESSWVAHLDIKTVAAQMFLLFPFDSRIINPVVWSLSYEMRISLVFPFIVALMPYFGIVRTLIASFAGSVVVAVVMIHSGTDLKLASLNTAWLPTFHYTFMFACGCALALSRTSIANWFAKFKYYGATFLVIATAYSGAFKLSNMHHLKVAPFLWDWLVTASVCGLIIILANPNRISDAARWYPFKFLGNVSYSLYLYHLLVLHAILYLYYGRLGLAPLLCLSLMISLALSYISYVLVELPSIRLGSFAVKRLNGSSLRTIATKGAPATE